MALVPGVGQGTLSVPPPSLGEISEKAAVTVDFAQVLTNSFYGTALCFEIMKHNPNMNALGEGEENAKRTWENIHEQITFTLRGNTNHVKTVNTVVAKLEYVFFVATQASQALSEAKRNGKNLVPTVVQKWVKELNRGLDEVEKLCPEIGKSGAEQFETLCTEASKFLRHVGATHLETSYGDQRLLRDAIEELQKTLFTLYDSYYNTLGDVATLKAKAEFVDLQIATAEQEDLLITQSIAALEARKEELFAKTEQELNQKREESKRRQAILEQQQKDNMNAFAEAKAQITATRNRVLQDHKTAISNLQQQLADIR